ncbi:MAG: NAD(P)H-hydrate dehydratase [Alphaproteobacteria bacterium]|nr:NAD(P)H-hydrate dehydratase [Alphaproteobacteria bacterium]
MCANKTPQSFAGTGEELLTVSEMYGADAAAISNGTSSDVLMENAGRAVVKAIINRWSARPVLILCGPGNNGGDGFVVARILADAGWPVKLALLGDVKSLTDDAAKMVAQWSGEIEGLDRSVLDGAELVIDALFGAGLSRAVDGVVATVIEEINRKAILCVAVDVPSGVNGDTGQVLGAAAHCTLTVTFFRQKPAHLLYPGREICGEIVVADIGIADEIMPDIAPMTAHNAPSLWLSELPKPSHLDHKYTRGYALIAGGAEMTGAARLSARAAARIGAGMVGIAAPEEVAAIYANDDPSFLIHQFTDISEFTILLNDERLSAAVIGPGTGVNQMTSEMALAALVSRKAVVLDADALTVFGDRREKLYEAIRGSKHVVMTPHEGEFLRLFDFTGDKLNRCRAAARKSGAVILLKGPDTVIAAPDGRAVINGNAPPTLATAGAGDVLAGLIAGLMAQGMEAFYATSAACWIHGEAASNFGPGLIASDLPKCIPAILKKLERISCT